MKITTRTACWGIELKNDTVTEEIYNSSLHELKDHSINFLEVVKDLINIMDVSEDDKYLVISYLDNALNTLEDF